MANIVINMTGDNADAIRQFQGVLAAEKKQEEALRKIGQESAKSAREFKKLEDAAKRVWEQTRTPLEKYNGEVAKLDRLMKTTTMTQDTYNRRVAQLKTEYQLAANAGKKAYGLEALNQVKGMITGYIGISTAINLITTSLNEMAAAEAEAAQKAKDSRMGMGSLGQVAVGRTQEEREADKKRLDAEARAIYMAGGAENLDQAARVRFALRSAGQDEYIDLFTQLRSTGLVQTPDVMVRAATTLISSMGKEETGDARALVSKAFGASLYSPATAEAILEASAKSGGSAGALKLRDEEVLAGTAIMSKTTGSADIGGTAFASLLRAIDKKRGGEAKKISQKEQMRRSSAGEPAIREEEKPVDFSGMSLKDILLKIQGMKLEGVKLQKFFGRQEAVRAYRDLLQNLPEYERAVADVERAERTDEVGGRLRLYQTDPSQVAAKKAEEQKAMEEVQRTGMGTVENIADTMQLRWKQASREEGDTRFGIWLRDWSATLDRKLLGDEGWMRMHQATRAAAGADSGNSRSMNRSAVGCGSWLARPGRSLASMKA